MLYLSYSPFHKIQFIKVLLLGKVFMKWAIANQWLWYINCEDFFLTDAWVIIMIKKLTLSTDCIVYICIYSTINRRSALYYYSFDWPVSCNRIHSWEVQIVYPPTDAQLFVLLTRPPCFACFAVKIHKLGALTVYPRDRRDSCDCL